MRPRTLVTRPQSIRALPLRPAPVSRPLWRSFASKDPPPPAPPKGPTQDVLPHVSEEAAAMAKITGETPPDIDQGTPISEVIKRDPSAQKLAPKVLKDQDTPGSKRQYSTVAEILRPVDAVDEEVPGLLVGAKYPLPAMPLPPNSHLHKRYSPILDQVTNLIMRDGKKATAQSVMNQVISILRTKGPPKTNPRTPIIMNAPPLESLPGNPLAYIQTAIDSVAPLMKIKSMKAAGGFREQVPLPLALRQRRRRAITWIIEAADKKKAKLGLAERLADEIVAVVEGRSSAWEKRMFTHKTGVAGRAHVKVK